MIIYSYLYHMNKNRLKEVLSIPSVYGEEGLVRDYIQSYAENEGIEYHIDKKGNIITIPAKEIKFEYRHNNLSEDLIFLSASFKGVKKNSDQIK